MQMWSVLYAEAVEHMSSSESEWQVGVREILLLLIMAHTVVFYMKC